MGNQTQQQQRQQQYQRFPEPKSHTIQVDNALATLQSMFINIDRSVLRMILMEQCKGNIDLAVETLLSMTGNNNNNNNRSVASSGTRVTASTTSPLKSASSSSSPSKKAVILYDSNMRPIQLGDDFLQPPSYLLSKYLNISPSSLSFNQLPNPIEINPVIIGQWTQLFNKYKFRNAQTMDVICSQECRNINKCNSLIRVIFMMKLYNNLCHGSGSGNNNNDNGLLMHHYLTKGFKYYSLIQLINDCNHLMQYHQLTNINNLNLKSIEDKNKFQRKMRSYFGHCDVMNCKIIKRILIRQDNNDNKDKMNDIDVEQDIVDKYHRVFYHPMN